MNPTPEQAALTAAMERAGEIEDACHNPNVFRLITGDQSMIVTLYRAVRRLQAALAEKDQQIAAAEQSENEDTQKFFLAADKCEDLEEQLAASQSELVHKDKRIETLCLEWAEDDTSVKAICAKHGINVDGDRWGFKGRIECLEELSQQLDASQQRVASLEIYKQRLEWLHTGGGPADYDKDGFEWGVFRVKYDQHGQLLEAWQTFSDYSDLDAEMARQAALATPAAQAATEETK